MDKNERTVFLWIFIGTIVIFAGSAIAVDLMNWRNWITLAISIPVYTAYMAFIFRVYA